MSYVRITARRDNGLEIEFEWDGLASATDANGVRCAEEIQRAADKAKAAITSKPETS